MPLKIEMKMGDRIIINGAVLEMSSPHAKMIVHNQAAILRGKEIISEELATTPATRVYFALQSAYLFPDHAAKYVDDMHEYLNQYLVACPTASEIVEDIRKYVADDQLYKALKHAQKLVIHQQGVLQDFEQQLFQLAEESGIEETDDVHESDSD